MRYSSGGSDPVRRPDEPQLDGRDRAADDRQEGARPWNADAEGRDETRRSSGDNLMTHFYTGFASQIFRKYTVKYVKVFSVNFQQSEENFNCLTIYVR